VTEESPKSQDVDTILVSHELRDMKRRNVTITLDEETARWARLEAARRDTSVSKLVGVLLREHMERECSYEAAQKRYFAVEPYLINPSDRLPSREELHERGRSDR